VAQMTPQEKARAALGRYRVMAWITGTVLLVFTLEIALKYGSQISGFGWVAEVHGAVYMVYAVSVLDLWSKMRWRFGRLATMMLAGVVPVMSFVLERRIHVEAGVQLAPTSGVAAGLLD
jgi:integral membrane protein